MLNLGFVKETVETETIISREFSNIIESTSTTRKTWNENKMMKTGK